MNTVLSEENKQRQEEVLERVEYLKALKNRSSVGNTPTQDDADEYVSCGHIHITYISWEGQPSMF